ncbi:hypothetical protein WKV44_07750 [Spirochaetia bacterium 38H-sp]|uniref:DUF4367 domain-containing protein n=1 Tax=Rarispira pelagica TaxID=3141764 RepID=A0ABU9UDB3_9SPIR
METHNYRQSYNIETFTYPVDIFSTVPGASDSNNNGFYEYDADGDGTAEELWYNIFVKIDKDSFDYYFQLNGTDEGTESLFGSADPLSLVQNGYTSFGVYREVEKSLNVENISESELELVTQDQTYKYKITYQVTAGTLTYDEEEYDSAGNLVNEIRVEGVMATAEEKEAIKNAVDHN